MDTKIQELTDKIYKEGVEKGNEEAGRIIAEANAQKDTIIKDAEAEAKRIVAAGGKKDAPVPLACRETSCRVEEEYGSRIEIVRHPVCRGIKERGDKPYHW